MTKRILVVEDQEDNRRILRDLLAHAGFDVIEVGEEFHLDHHAGCAFVLPSPYPGRLRPEARLLALPPSPPDGCSVLRRAPSVPASAVWKGSGRKREGAKVGESAKRTN